jgi:hypothetical protein
MISEFLDKIHESIFRKMGKHNFREYKFTSDGLRHYNELKPNSRDILFKLLSNVRYKEPYITMTYEDFGYNDKRFFGRYRKELLDNHFIFMDGDTYLINPMYIRCYSKKLKE